jgi:hypothetical protein
VGILNRLRLDDSGLQVKLPIGARDCSLLQSVQTGCEVHTSCVYVVGAVFQGILIPDFQYLDEL